MSSHVFERLQEVKEVFGHHPSIRHHVDQVDDVDNPIVIYEYYHCHALDLMRNETEYPLQLRKKIIRDTGSALQCIHENGWMHGGKRTARL